jgi:hypothetical protein
MATEDSEPTGGRSRMIPGSPTLAGSFGKAERVDTPREHLQDARRNVAINGDTVGVFVLQHDLDATPKSRAKGAGRGGGHRRRTADHDQNGDSTPASVFSTSTPPTQRPTPARRLPSA